jgi:FtsH-binding integral membrane protein
MTEAEAAAIDAGLRDYMVRIYSYMGLGLATTGTVALATYWLSVTKDPEHAAKLVRGGIQTPAYLAGKLYLTPLGHAVFVDPLRWVVILAPLAFGFGLGFGVKKLSPLIAQVLFWLYAVLVGLSLGSFFMIYTQTSVERVFFVTAASFGALSLWGYSTRGDLTALRAFVIMGVFGVVVAGLVNVVLESTTLHWTMTILGVLAFAGLAASDAQRLKIEYIYGAVEGDIAERSAISGALSLYLDFLNLFALLVPLQGSSEE